jgi:hypothetical protein
MANREPLLEFIKAAKSQGANDDFLVTLLRESGWPDKQIFEAFGEHYRSLTGLPVPARRGGGERSKEAFLYLLSFSTLSTWTIALGSLFFTLIEIWFPDPLQAGRFSVFSFSMLSNNVAALIVAFPIYLFVMRLILRTLRENPESYDSPIRKWLTYLAMLIAAGIVICDLVTFLAYFLRGDLTARFVLKVLVVLVIAGVVLAYYLASLRRPAGEAAGDA